MADSEQSGVGLKSALQEIEARFLPLRRPVLKAFAAELAQALEDTPYPGSLEEQLAAVTLDVLRVEASAWSARERDRAALVQAVLAAETPASSTALLARHLKEVTKDAAPRKRRLRSLEGDLDLEGVLDLEAVELARGAQRIQGLVDILSSLDLSKGTLPGEVAERLLVVAAPPFWDTVRADALICLARKFNWRSDQLSDPQLAQVQKIAVDDAEDAFVRRGAFELWLRAEPNAAGAAALSCLEAQDEGDVFFLRARLVELPAVHAAMPVEQLPASDDPSELVRQCWVAAMAARGTAAALARLSQLTEDDPSRRVRGAALQAFAACVGHDEGAALATSAFLLAAERSLSEERDPLVLRCLLASLQQGAVDGLFTALAPALNRFVAETPSSELSLLAANVLLELEVHSDDALKARRERLRASLAGLAEGSSAPLKVEEDDVLERALLTSAPGDYQLSIRRTQSGLRLQRGVPRVRRLWRGLFELSNLRPDKRQDTLHTIGRRDRAALVVPPQGLAEVTQTKVPGERRVVSRLGHWAPFLPRVDDFLEALEMGAARTVLSPAGAVRIYPPSSTVQRLRARLRLIREYAAMASLREASLDAAASDQQAQYIDSMLELGFQVSFESHRGEVDGERFQIDVREVAPFFRGTEVFVPVLFDGPFSYLLDDQGNFPAHLLWVIVIGLLWLLLRSAVRKREIGNLVGAVPWVIGGWGTRGKSGTERLKAALFQGSGLDVWAKTTGCEAMMIHGIPTRPAHEVFLYRPYDKPTIWEQIRVLEISKDAGAQVFLWECMALNPRYVAILSHEWMRPQISTITNAYPDHEDVQGPSGEDVARVIASFTPRRALCFTAEDQMLPIIREEAARVNTALEVVTPVEADLLPIDLLSRFPYQEHPRNILLVGRMAEQLGVERDRAIALMADQVVPDLGVLKTYPEIQHRSRRLYFTNGMSANERAGCLSNWERLGLYDRQGPSESIVTVVNNRWDRIPRSRVFAKIIVEDITADAHLLIGSNLGGLHRFIVEALDEWLEKQSLLGRADEEESGLAQDEQARRLEGLAAFFARLRIPSSPAEVREAVMTAALSVGLRRSDLQGALEGMDFRELEPVKQKLSPLLNAEAGASDADRTDVLEWVTKICSRYLEMDSVRESLLKGTAWGEVERDAKAVYRRIFLSNVHILPQVQATGDQVIDQAAATVAPGQRAHLIGLQNIKGTGLDFVYRWLSLERTSAAIEDLSHPAHRASALIELGSYTGYGLFDCVAARRALSREPESLEPENVGLWRRARGHVEALEERLAARLEIRSTTSWVEQWCNAVERWLDPLDSIYRAFAARRVQGQLAQFCISQARAAEKMRKITSRDKGGWLYKTLLATQALLASWNRRLQRVRLKGSDSAAR